MRLLDLFCGAGGAAMGYFRAGFTDITGIDNRPMPRYPFKFIQADALEYLRDHGHEYDVIHASPPCQFASIAAQKNRNEGKRYPDLLTPIRSMLIDNRKPFIIENVPGAPIRPDLTLCGSLFGLQLVRHRLFEFDIPHFMPVPSCAHHPNPITVCGHGTPSWVRKKTPKLCWTQDSKRQAMGIDWMNRGELSQAIPPAYTEFIGKQLMETIAKAREE